MSRNSLFSYFVVLAFSPLIFCVKSYNTMCKDCREESQEYCLIRNSTGYSILPYTYVLSESRFFVPVIDDLSDCIPAHLIIKERKFSVLCVWSPQLGCQMLVDYAFRATDCLECRIDSLEDGIPRCPCEKVSKRTREKIGDLSSGSGHMCRGTLQIMILVIISVIIFNKETMYIFIRLFQW